VQVEPIKPTLKPPVTKRLKLTYDELLSRFAFKFNLCRYNLAQRDMYPFELPTMLFKVAWCRLTVSKPEFKLRLVSVLETKM